MSEILTAAALAAAVLREVYRVTSLIRKRTPLEPYSKNMTKCLWWSQEDGVFYKPGTPVTREGGRCISLLKVASSQ